MSDISVLIYSSDGAIAELEQYILDALPDHEVDILVTGPVQTNGEDVWWVESFDKPIVALQKLLYEVDTQYVMVLTEDAYPTVDSLSECVREHANLREESVLLLRGNDGHSFLPLTTTGYLAEVGGFDCQYTTVVDACNDFITRVFRDDRKIVFSDRMDVVSFRQRS